MARRKRAKPKVWKSFEDAARSIFSRNRDLFNLESVEPGPARAQGRSGYVWNIEVVGYSNNLRKIVIFEVRRRKRNVEPAQVSEVLGRIEEVQAQKGYIVTGLGRRLSVGAQKIAGFHQIGHVELSVDATPDVYVLKYLNQFFVGLADSMQFSESVEAIVRDKDGNVNR